jgi:hypothetical protein
VREQGWYNDPPLRRSLILIGIAGTCMSGIVLAAQDCATVRQKSGEAAYQKCLFNEEEALIKEQLAAYKAMIERNQESVKTRYDHLINQENFSWKDVDLQMQIEEAQRKLRITQLGSAKENAAESQIEKNLLVRLQKIRSLTSTVHRNKVSKLQSSRKAELQDYESALKEYELQLRRQKMPSL